jgi:diguanylate cyclase (GGDEF)-like protein
MVILPLTTKEEAILAAEKLRVSVVKHTFSLKTNNPITISLGVGELLKNKTIAESLCSVDEALYCAKKEGRNRVEVSQ